MKKKALMLALSATLFLGACGSEEEKQEVTVDDDSKTEQVENEAELGNFPEGEMGDGYFYLQNESGDTSMGEPISVLYEEDTIGIDFDIVTEDFDGSYITYIYIDNELIDKEQLGDSQIQFEVPEHIKQEEGTHIVSLVQYEDDDTDNEAVTVKHDAFEIKK